MKAHINHFITSFIDWCFRKRSKGLRLISFGVSLLALAFAGNWIINASISTSSGPFEFSFDSGQASPIYLILLALLVALLLIVVGLFFLINEEIKLSKKRAVAIELRGLRDFSGNALMDKIPSKIKGRREQILINIRRSDGEIQNPEDALREVLNLPISISQKVAGSNRSDFSFAVGGLAPVPFSFLTGVLIDDENNVTLMDWDRIKGSWRALDGIDDEARFSISGLDQVGDADEIVLSISISYPTDTQGIAQSFPKLPIVSLVLPNLSFDGHWSNKKQKELTSQFFDTVCALSGRGIKNINLIMAAPNSLVLQFGRIYDKRNLPPLTVWQYENGQTPPYPWGVKMPVCGYSAEIRWHS